jgi:DNA repair exonuclease SbcCD ATPase subunit
MIKFKQVRWKNLLSSGNKFTTIELDRSSTTLILGENGAGKSTLLDALCFGLYGKGFRNLKKELLVNSVNGKELLVEVDFEVGKKKYKVIRGTRPNRFELYLGKTMLNQDASVRDYQDHLEKNILKMSHRSFTQVAILGSANFTPFMQLKAKDRRKLVEDLLDISIFSTMRDILRKKVQSHKIEIKDTDHEVEILEERISGLTEQLNALQKNRDEQIGKYESTVKETENNIANLMEKVDEKTQNVVEKESTITNKSTTESKLKQIVELEKQLEATRKKANTDIEFYENNDNCPTCKQGLDHEHKKKHIEEKQNKISEIKTAMSTLDKQVSELRDEIDRINEVQHQINEVQREIGLLQTEVTSNQKYIHKLNGQIKELSKNISGDDSVQNRLTSNEDDLDKLHAKQKTLKERGHYFELAQLLLKDEGIKSKIIKQYVPVMNKMITKYLASLEFYVGFELDENFEETIKSRFRDVFKYDNFSQGEKMRIDLALLFTWRSVARMKNSVNTNLLILDEVFDSSLDAQGTDDFLRLLNTLSEKTNAFIISHKGDQLYDKFEEVIKFEKYKNFSRISVS